MSPLTSGEGRVAWGDAAKGLLIVFVVFWHVTLKTYLEVDWRVGIPIPGLWGLGSDLIWPFLLPLFLLISGFFAAEAVNRPWSAVFGPRVARFLYLYLLWTLIHMGILWAFPDFPTFVPRNVAEFVEAVTISPPNTWYLYALALYFVVAKVLRRVPRAVLIVGAAALTVAVSAGAVDVISNRGSLFANLLFFLIGVHFAPQIRRLTAVRRPLVAAALLAGYLAAEVVMRMTATEEVPGVWLVVSVLGVSMGLAVAPFLPTLGRVGRGLTWLGARTLPIYVIHLPILAIIDAAAVPWLSEARIAVQLVAAVLLPAVLTALVVAVSVLLGRLLTRDGLRGFFELPVRGVLAGRRILRIPWRSAVAGVVVVALGLSVAGATAIPDPPDPVAQQAAVRAGEVSIGATGDLLLYDVGHAVPADRGRGHLDEVRPWFTEDLVTGNLEQAISDDTGYDKCGEQVDCLTFRSDPDAAAFLQGFDILNLANNHSRDFGQSGYDATRENLAEAGIRAVGDRDEIAYTRVGDITVAVVGFAPYGGFNRVTDLRQVRRIVRVAAENADVVVVHAHLGAEGPGADVVTPGTESMYGEDRGDPIAFAHAAVDAGADLVIGHGPHVLRGMEFYRGRLIAYSLGNFGGGGVFGAEGSTRYGAYLSVRLRADGTLIGGEVRSVRFAYQGGAPTPDPDRAAATLMNERGRRDFEDAAVTIGPTGSIVTPDR